MVKLPRLSVGGREGKERLIGVQGDFPRDHGPSVATHHAHAPRLRRADPRGLGWHTGICADLRDGAVCYSCTEARECVEHPNGAWIAQSVDHSC